MCNACVACSFDLFVSQIWTEVRNSSIKEFDLSDLTHGNSWIIGFRCYAVVTCASCRGWLRDSPDTGDIVAHLRMH